MPIQTFRVVAFMLFSVLVSSCATTPEEKYRSEISGLTDMSLVYIESKWGGPDFNLPKTTGRIVKFKDILVREEEPLSGVITKKLCIVALRLNKEGLVKDWSYDNCRPLNPAKTKAATKDVVDPSIEQSDFDLDERKLPGVEGSDAVDDLNERRAE